MQTKMSHQDEKKQDLIKSTDQEQSDEETSDQEESDQEESIQDEEKTEKKDIALSCSSFYQQEKNYFRFKLMCLITRELSTWNWMIEPDQFAIVFGGFPRRLRQHRNRKKDQADNFDLFSTCDMDIMFHKRSDVSSFLKHIREEGYQFKSIHQGKKDYFLNDIQVDTYTISLEEKLSGIKASVDVDFVIHDPSKFNMMDFNINCLIATDRSTMLTSPKTNNCVKVFKDIMKNQPVTFGQVKIKDIEPDVRESLIVAAIEQDIEQKTCEMIMIGPSRIEGHGFNAKRFSSKRLRRTTYTISKCYEDKAQHDDHDDDGPHFVFHIDIPYVQMKWFSHYIDVMFNFRLKKMTDNGWTVRNLENPSPDFTKTTMHVFHDEIVWEHDGKEGKLSFTSI